MYSRVSVPLKDKSPHIQHTPYHRTEVSWHAMHFSIYSDQTQLLLQKMAVLERKLLSLETKLQLVHLLCSCRTVCHDLLYSQERTQKLHLEAKVVRLEEENKVLQQSRAKAGQQLHNFAERFYSATDAVKAQTVPTVTPSESPHQSLVEFGKTETESTYRMSTVSI